jgi:hypothetical protein
MSGRYVLIRIVLGLSSNSLAVPGIPSTRMLSIRSMAAQNTTGACYLSCRLCCGTHRTWRSDRHTTTIKKNWATKLSCWIRIRNLTDIS